MDLIGADYHRTIGSDKIIDLRGSWDRSGEHGIWPYEVGPGVDDTFGIRWRGEAHLHWDIRPNARLTGGAEYTNVSRARYQYRVGDYLTRFARPYDIKSFFAEYEYRPTPRLGIVVGIRHDNFSATADSTNPRFAILFTPNESTTLKLLQGSAFRSPNVYEALYADPVTPWKANPDLKPERIRTTELALQQRLSPDLFFAASAFHNKASAMIDQQVDPNDGIYSYQNLNRITSNGIELRLDRRSNRAWAYLSYSFVDADDAEGNIDNHPRQMLKGGVSTSPWQALHFGLDAVLESARFTRDEQKTEPALLLNGTISKQLGDHLRLGLRARNLLDRHYATPVGPELRQQTIRQDGRTLTLEVTYSR
jgi:iron complex outermembrane receptor protein